MKYFYERLSKSCKLLLNVESNLLLFNWNELVLKFSDTSEDVESQINLKTFHK